MSRANLVGKIRDLFKNDITRVSQPQTIKNTVDNNWARKHDTPYKYNQGSNTFGTGNYNGYLDIDFSTYDLLDTDPLISNSLDILAEESTQKNESGLHYIVMSDNPELKEELEYLFNEVMKINVNLLPWTRSMLKYGNNYLRMIVDEENGGITRVFTLNPYDIRRSENTSDNKDSNSNIIFNVVDIGRDLENYEILHFRLLTDANLYPYGRSVLFPVIRSWQQLFLLEEAMMIHKITRAPDKRMVFVDVGDLTPGVEVDQYIDEVSEGLKRTKFVDPRTGQYNLTFNVHNVIEDFYIPTRGDTSSITITPLAGDNLSYTDEIELLQNKIISSLKIPREYLNYGTGESSLGQSSLSIRDIRLARSISTIQDVLLDQLYKASFIHLYTKGFSDEDILDYKIKLINPSTIFEKEKIELYNEKVKLAENMMKNNLFSKQYIYENIFDISEEDYDIITLENRLTSREDYILDKIKKTGEEITDEEGEDSSSDFDIGDFGSSDFESDIEL